MGCIGCCEQCDVNDMPELSIDGMTGDGWAVSTTEIGCCYVQTFTFDATQPAQDYFSANVHAAIQEATSVYQDLGVKVPIPPERYQSDTFPSPLPDYPDGPCCAEDPVVVRTYTDYGKQSNAYRWALSIRPVSIEIYCTKKLLSCESGEEYFVFRAVFNHRYITGLQSHSYSRRLRTFVNNDACANGTTFGMNIDNTTGSETFLPALTGGPSGFSPIVRFVYIRAYPASSVPASLTFDINEVTQDFETCLEDLCISEAEITEICFAFDPISPVFSDTLPNGVSIVDSTVAKPTGSRCVGETITVTWVDACPPTTTGTFNRTRPVASCGNFTLKRVQTTTNPGNHAVQVVNSSNTSIASYTPACFPARDPCTAGWHHGGYDNYYGTFRATQDSLAFSRTFINPIDGEICVPRPTFVVDIAP
jgi:hypothetical protein